MKYVLVTGGAGYIGSHTTCELINHGYEPVIFDNFSNSSLQVIRRIEDVTGKAINYMKGDVRDGHSLQKLFEQFSFEAVVHFAGLKSVQESTEEPLKYFDNNVRGTLELLQVMQKHAVKKLVFSSSATVYGEQSELPLREDMVPNAPANPYGMSKLLVERVLHSTHEANNSWNIINLRYFNPVGAHPSGLLGEDPAGVPNNLMPFVTQTAIGQRECLFVYGDKYDTHDGTGVRDYLHVIDLAAGHVKAIEKLEFESGFWTINLGTGKGHSVLEVIKSFEEATGKKLPYRIVGPRAGDVGTSYADVTLAKRVLQWEAHKGLKEMCEDAWRWQAANPKGYHVS